MALLQSRIDSFNYSINPALVVNRKIKYALQWSKGSLVITDTIERVFADSMISIFQNNANSIAGWSQSGNQNWALTSSDFISSPSSIHDSPFGNYSASSSYIITGTNEIDLTKTDFAYLEFYSRWDIERGHDYAQVLASESGKNIWIPLCGAYTSPGSADQDPGNPIYDGTQNTWVREYINLSDFLGKKILLRFQLISDMYTQRDGYFLDEVSVVRRGIPNNTGISNSQNPSISIQPNPAQDYIHILINNVHTEGIIQYDIKDITGRTVYNIQSEDPVKTIEISGLSPGIYILNLIIDDKKIMEKFIVR